MAANGGRTRKPLEGMAGRKESPEGGLMEPTRPFSSGFFSLPPCCYFFSEGRGAAGQSAALSTNMYLS